MKIICFDIGGTKILKAVVKISGKNYKFLEVEEEKNPRQEKKIKNILSSYCQSAQKKYWTKKVAVSAARIVDPTKKTISQGKVCYGTDLFDLKFFENDGFSLRVENDGRCFALGEHFFGKGKDKKSVLSLTLGSGIGAGYVDKKYILRGSNFSAMEVSHIKYLYGRKYEVWENLTVGRGIEKLYHGFSKKRISAVQVFGAAKEGDAAARKAIAEAAFMLGIGMANVMNIFDPEIVIFGGGMSDQKDFVKKAVAIAKKNIFNKKANYKFAISALGNKANLLGAASLYK